MANNSRIDLNVGFNIDRSTYDNVIKALTDVQVYAQKALDVEEFGTKSQAEFKKVLNTAKDLEKVFNQSWDNKLNQINLTRLNNGLRESKTNAVQAYQALAQFGNTGQKGADAFARSIMEANVELVKTNKLVDKMAVTFGNTIRYGISSSIFNTFTNSIRNAYEYTKQLDTSLNDIRIVSGKSADEMAELAVQANKAAQALGKTTLDYTKAATIFYQQGLDTDEVEKRTEIVLKAANVTGQSAQEVSEQLTAVWNGYQVPLEQLELYVDKLSAVAASSASNLEELSSGMSKVASAANIMGVDIDQLTAQMSTIISVTRQAPESVGTALRTIYARIADIKAGIDGDTTLGNYSGKMHKLGFDVLDASGNLKEMGDVIEEIGGKWTTLTREQQVSLAQTMAGTRQYNNLLTLFDNWDKYTNALNTSRTAAGKLQDQQDIYMESTEAHLNQLRAEAEELYAMLFDQEAARTFIDILTSGLKTITGYIKTLGGGLNTFLGLGSQVANLFSGKIADSIGNFLEKRETKKENKALLKGQKDIAETILAEHIAKGEKVSDSAIAKEAQLTKDLLKVKEKLTQEDFKRLTAEKNRIALLEDEKATLQEDVNEKRESLEGNKWNKISKIKVGKGKTRQNLDINNIASVSNQLEVETGRLESEFTQGTAEYEAQQQIVKLLQERKALLEDIAKQEDLITDKTKEQNALEEDINKNTKNAGRKLNAQNVIKYSTAALQGMTILAGTIKTFGDEASSAEDKANALYNGIVGAGAAVANAFLPGSGILVEMAGGLLDNLGITKAMADWFKTDAEREQEEIDKLKSLGQEMNNEYQRLSGMVSNLKSQWDTYDSVVETLYKCAKGSNDWQEALSKVNATVADILAQYPALAKIPGIIEYTADGMMKINKELYDTYIQQLQNEATVKQFTAIAANNEASSRQLELDKKTTRNQAQKDFVNQMVLNKYPINSNFGEQEAYRQEVTNKLGLDDTTWNKLIDNAQNNASEYYSQVQGLAQNMIEMGYATEDQAEHFVSSMEKSRESFAQLQTRTDDYSNTLVNSMKLLTNAQWGGEGATGLKTVLYANEYQKAENSVTSAQDLHDYWAYAKNGGLDITRDTSKSDEAYTNLIADINKRIGSGKYEVARDISDADVIRGADGSEAVVMYNTTTGENESHTLEEWARIVNEEEKLRASLTKDINDAASEFVDNLKEETGLDSDTLTKVFSDGFDISQLTEEEAAQVQAHKDEILSYYQEMTKDITDEDAKKIALDYMNNLDRELQDNWDAAAHAEILKQQFKETIAQAATNAEENYKLDKEGFQGYSNYIAEIAEENDKLVNSLKDDGKAAAVVTQSVMRMNKGIETLAKSMEDWDDILNKSSKDSYEYYEALDGIKDGMADILDVEKSAISNKFIEEHLPDINKAAEGNAEAIDKLRDAYADQIILDIVAKTDFDDASVTTTKEQMIQAVNDLQAEIPNLKIGAVDDKDFLKSCQELIDSSHMTVEDANKLFESLGFETEFVTKKEPVEKTGYSTITSSVVRGYDTFDTVDADGNVKQIKIPSIETFTKPGTQYKYTDYVDAIAMSTDGNTPQIKSMVKKAGGSMNNYSSSNSGGKSAGGSKGKGGGSSAKPSKKDPNKDELDRYQLVNVQLKEIGKELTKLDKEKNKLLGGNLLKNLNNQIKLLNDQITVTEAKLKIAKDEQSEVAGKLAGYGIKFDSQGNIANYAQIFKQEQAKLNAVYDAFNGMSKDAQESYEDTVKAAEETWNAFKNSISKYDNLIGETIPSLQQEIRDAFDKQTEIFIEEFNMEVKLRLDTSSMLRDWNEFRRKVIDGIKDDDILGTAKAKLADFESYYNATGTAEIQALTKRLQQQLEEVREQDATGSAEWYRDNRAKAIEDLKDNYDKIRQSLTDIIKLEEEMQQKVLDMMNEAQEKFDEQIGTFENINKHLEHNIELINLLTDQNDYEALAKQYEAQTKNREQELDFYTKQKDYWENYLKTLEEGSKEWEEAKAKYNEAADAWASAIQTTIEAARKEFENNINLIFKTINNQLTDNKGLDYLNTEWELLKDNSDMVLDNINKMQKFQDLTQKYNDAINSTSNIKAQQKLAELRDQELAALKEMGSISEKDLERAEKKLNIVKAQIALEDAQRNKTQMRLRRDSQGNYRYQFVADEEEVEKAQQNLANAYNELYNFDKERYKSNLNDAYAAWNEYQEKMAEAALINDPEVRGQREELLTKEYNERILILTEENERIKQELNESTIAELNNLYAQNADNYNLMTDEQKAALSDYEAASQTAFDLVFDLYTENTEKFHDMTQDQLDVIENQMVPQWTSGYQALIDKIQGAGGIEEVSADLTNQLHDEVESYKQDLADVEVAAGDTFGNISDDQNEIIQNTKDMLDANDGLIDKYTEMTDVVMDQYQALKDLMGEYEQAAKDAKQAAEDAYNYIMKEKDKEANDAKDNVDAGPTTGGTGNYNPTSEPTQTSTPAPTPTVKTPPATPFSATLSKGTALYRADGSQYPRGTQADRTVTVKTTSGSLWQVWGSTFDPHTVYIKKSALGYDTGGYTGTWGDSGRLAFLHQKELVLNKEDTANMLNAVEILRGITENISADVLGKIAGASSIGMNGAVGNSALDQNVHITATFPGVTSSIEIQDALNNLVNMAAQRAQIR